MSSLRRVLYVSLLALAMLALAPAPAQADWGIDIPGIEVCKTPPVPDGPSGGTAGFFDIHPDKPTGPDWVNGAPSYQHYGLAGMRFTNYDLGCTASLTDTMSVAGTGLANWILEGCKFAIAATGAALHAAFEPTYLAALDPLVQTASDTMRDVLFLPWAPVALLVVGCLILWASHTGRSAKNLTVAAWALFVMVAATVVFTYPVKAAHVADGTVASVLGAVNSGVNGAGSTDDPTNASVNAMTNAVLFQQWKMGTFGRSNGPTADKYAEAIYKATSLTYAEEEVVHADPDGKGQAIIEAKRQAFTDTASKIETEDPSAYEFLTGRRGETRFGAAIVVAIATLCAATFLLIGSALLIGSFLVIRFGVMLLPAFATLGIPYATRGAVVGVALACGAAVVNSLMFGVAVSVYMLGLRIVLDPATGLAMWLALLLLLLATLALWYLTKPMRRLTAMASPSRMFHDAAGGLGSATSTVKRKATSVATNAASAAWGANWAIGHNDGDWQEPDRARVRTEAKPTEEPIAATPGAGLAPLQPVPMGPGPSPQAPPQQAPQAALEPVRVTAEQVRPEPHTPAPLEPVEAPRLALPAAPAAVTPEAASEGIIVPSDDERIVAPPVADMTIDPETGQEVYDLFVPDEPLTAAQRQAALDHHATWGDEDGPRQGTWENGYRSFDEPEQS